MNRFKINLEMSGDIQRMTEASSLMQWQTGRSHSNLGVGRTSFKPTQTVLCIPLYGITEIVTRGLLGCSDAIFKVVSTMLK